MKKTIITLAAIAVIALLLSSCATNGYGCKGKGKIMTRVRQ